jgi:hypothetical protein
MSKANYDLPNATLAKVVKLSGARSKREAIIIALDEYIKKKLAEELIGAFGKFKLKWTQKTLRAYRG